jgi:ubiquinone/menaquinone biosynthesis C-methylase UbiE
MSVTQTRIQPPPVEISRFLYGTWAEQVIKSAVELNLFDALKSGPKSAEDIATVVGADLRGIGLLLKALVGMNLLQKNAGGFELTEIAALYMLPDSDLYFGDYLLGRDQLAMVWEGLTDAVKTGKSQTAINRQEAAEEFFPWLAAAIFPMSYTTAQAAAELLQVEALPATARVLDVAAGSGVWSIPMAQRNPGLQVDAVDFPATLNVTRKFTDRYQLSERYRYLEGSWQNVDFGEAQYDLVLLGHILHSEGWQESEKLLAKAFRALKPGGRIMIAEFLINDNSAGQIFPQLFGINMYLVTENGCVFSDKELKDLLTTAGFKNAERLAVPYYGEESPLMVATRPE